METPVDFTSEMIVQDILTLIERKTRNISYLKSKDKTVTMTIIIPFDEFICEPTREELRDALNYISALDSTWIPTGNDDEEKLFSIINFVIFTEHELKFQISNFYLIELRRTGFNRERLVKRIKELKPNRS